MKSDNLSPNQKDMLLMLEESGYCMLEIINNSLDLMKMERGSYQVNPVPVDILTLIQQIKGETRNLFNKKGLAFDISINGESSDETQTFMVSGEKMLCYSMLANLIKNAIEASPENDQIKIMLNDGECQIVKIHNKGAIPIQIRETFFDKYATFGKKEGTGLGTYSARLISRTLKGDITFESSERLGTTLIIYLPPVSSIPAVTAVKKPSSPQSGKPATFDKERIVLVADDYSTMRHLIISLLSQMGFTNYVEAGDGLEALKQIESQQIDLIISDWNMPFKTGIDILKHIRSNKRLKHIPFIMMTGEPKQAKVVEAAKVGVTSFVVKPFSPDLLRKKIESVLTQSL
ncbi:MAG: response regulator [Desulfamplus sp.]|nr:response regulator [Desulfamplus sp.]